jgi:hypothetical protein
MKLINLIVLISCISNCQISDPIQTDRPDQTETPSLVPMKIFQLETGFIFQKNDSENKNYTLPTFLWKYGIHKNLEVRLITEICKEHTLEEKKAGINTILIGAKIRLKEEKGIIPKTSIIGHVNLPNLASSNLKTNHIAPEFRFTMQHTISDKLTLSYNMGSEWNGENLVPTYIYTCSTGYALSEKTGYYIEIFGFVPNNEKSNHQIDGGITYLINDNFMLDLSSGIGISRNAPKYYLAFGFSFRI